VDVGVESTEQVTAEGTNAGGDEVEASGAEVANSGLTSEVDTSSIIAELIYNARAAMTVFIDYDQRR
jgi:hypothetical protein